MLLVQKKRYVVLVYDGPGRSHQETKGIELVRRDWCGLTKYMSAFILDQFLYGPGKDEAIENIVSELSRIAELMRNDGRPPSDGILPQLHSRDPPSDHLLDLPTDASTSSASSERPPPPSLLPTAGFPQMYGVARPPPGADAPRPAVPLKGLNRPSETPAAILRNYGIEGPPSERVQPIERIGVEQLTIHMSLSRPLDKYQDRMTPHVAVAQRMVARGEHVAANMTIAFVIAKTGAKDVGECARIPDEVASVADTDIEWYLANQVMAPIWRLCEPFGGMDVRMIARALGLVVPESYVPAQRDECVAVVIPHTTELRYRCANCGENVDISERLKSHVTCPKCQYEHNWKYVANRVIEFARRYIKERRFVCDGNLCDFESKQLPISCRKIKHRPGCEGQIEHSLSCVAMFNTLSYFGSLYEKSMNRDDLPLEPFRAYVHEELGRLLGFHGFSKIQLSSVFSQYSPGASGSEPGPS
jgi:DNA polymerase alpha subunit A